MAVLAHPRKNKALLFGVIALVFLGGTGAAGYWWHEHNKPSQASKADCVLAQKIVDEAQGLPRDKAAVEAWEQSTMKLRRSQMKDGYLGFRIAQYEVWAALNAKGEGTPPGDNEVDRLAGQANGHCTDAGVKLAFPSIPS